MPRIVASKNRKFNLAKLITAGRLSPKARIEAKKLLRELKKEDRCPRKILDISYNLHQHISSSMDAKQYLLREDADYNVRVTGTSLYHESDMIAHGDYMESYPKTDTRSKNISKGISKLSKRIK